MPLLDQGTIRGGGRKDPRVSRNRTASTKLSRTEYTEIEQLAEARGQWISEWVRDVLLAAIEEQQSPQKAALFAEVQALRLLLINTLEPLLRGDKMTAEQFKAMLQHVKTNKRKVAADILVGYREEGTAQS